MSFPWNRPEPSSPPRRPRSDLNKHRPLPPISAENNKERRAKGKKQASVKFAKPVQPDKLSVIQQQLHATEHSTRTLLQEALRTQSDIDQAFQMSQEIWRDEQQRRTMLSNHVSSITNVVKSLSRELDSVEGRVKEQLAGLRQHCQALQARLDASFSQLGFTHVQQEHVNTRVREAFQAVTSSQQSFQTSIQDQLRRFGERLDSLAVQVNHSLASKASTDSIGHMQTTGLTEAQAALNVRVENLDGKVSQLLQDLRTANEDMNEIRLQQQQQHMSLQSAIEDVRRSVAEEREERKRQLEETTKALREHVDESCTGVQSKTAEALTATTKSLDHKIVQLQTAIEEQAQQVTRDRGVLETQLTSTTSQEVGRLDTTIHDLQESLQRVKARQKEQVQTLDMLADALDEKTAQLSDRIESVVKSVVIV